MRDCHRQHHLFFHKCVAVFSNPSFSQNLSKNDTIVVLLIFIFFENYKNNTIIHNAITCSDQAYLGVCISWQYDIPIC